MEVPGVVRDTDGDLESFEMDAMAQPQALPTAKPSVWVATSAKRMLQQEFTFWVSFLQYVVVNNTFEVQGLVANLQLSMCISPKNGSRCLLSRAAANYRVFGSNSSNSALNTGVMSVLNWQLHLRGSKCGSNDSIIHMFRLAWWLQFYSHPYSDIHFQGKEERTLTSRE